MDKDWKYYFYEISKIPRKSGNEEKIKEYLVNFAKQRNLEYYTDNQNNVIIWKKVNNQSNNEFLGLQAHVDMICEKEKGSNHNFATDPIEIIEQDGFLKARGTSLGADNGIGVACILAILDSTTVKHPNLEAIFTTEEETTMNGSQCIDKSKIKSKKIISFDNFNENEIWIGSASSQEWYTEIDSIVEEKQNIKTFKLSLTNFIGGHAGMDIGDEKRGNPIKVAFNILKDTNVYINQVNGGTLINVIPSSCEVIFSVNENDEQTIVKINENISNKKSIYIRENIELKEVEKQSLVINYSDSEKIINCINSIEIGAINRDEIGNVVVGVNLSKVELVNGKTNINFCVRGNRRVLTDKCVEKLKQNIIQNYNLIINRYDEFNGYEQPRENELIKICEKIYEEETCTKPNVLGVQACLECEFFGKKIKDLQYVALGTNTYDVHSISERVEIESVNRMWKIIIKILNCFYERS